MAHAYPKLHAERFPWHAAFHCCPNFLPFFRPTIVSNCEEHVYMWTYDCLQTVYELPLPPNDTAVTHFYTNRSGAKCWLDIWRWGRRPGGDRANTWHWAESLTVHFLYRKWQQHSYCHVLLLTAFLERTFITNIMCLYRVLIIVIIIIQ
jgi:hypothetical protein